MAPVSFTTLPAELRIRIYEYVLAAGVPIERRLCEYQDRAGHPIARLRQESDGTPSEAKNLLTVNRLTYKEALPSLFKVNTISATRSDFCNGVISRSDTHVAIKHLVNLELSNFVVPGVCDLCVKEHMCGMCHDAGFSLLNYLTSLPHLRTITINYGGSKRDQDTASTAAFARFRSTLRRPSYVFYGLTLTCTATGEYKLEGSMLGGSTALSRTRIRKELQVKLGVLLTKAAFGRGLGTPNRFADIPGPLFQRWPFNEARLSVAPGSSFATSELREAFDRGVQEYLGQPLEGARWVEIPVSTANAE
ncbi:hypothetical protein LTR85_008962 [Meristemomyces frigidus]|nr:hypothetical protein LTR85_008962 [Meristemomyces frigidus]